LLGVETRTNVDETPQIHTFPPDLLVRRSLIAAPIQPLARSDIAQQSGTLAMAGTPWRVSGVGGRGRFLYLAETRPREVRQGTLLLAQGRLVRGGISFGLVRDGVWAAQLAVTAPGSFVAIVRAPQDGEYEVALGNY